MMRIPSRSKTLFHVLSALLLAFVLPAAAHGQQRGREEAGVVPAERMRAFLQAVTEEPLERVAAFFPRRGEWTWVQTFVDRPGRAGAWRFRADETLRAIGEGGPACLSFAQPSGEIGPPEVALAMQAVGHGTRWRRVRGNRFVAPEGEIGSHAWVEWRREDGEWVVSSFGDGAWYHLPLLGTPRNGGRRDPRTGAPAGPVAYAEHARWYVNNEPIDFEGGRYVKYGLPRKLAEHEVARIGSLGLVPVYAEAGNPIRVPDVLYLPVRPGEFQPYQGYGAGPCG